MSASRDEKTGKWTAQCYYENWKGEKKPLKTYPLLSTLYSLAKEFYTAIFSKKPEKLNAWIESAQKHDIPELFHVEFD